MPSALEPSAEQKRAALEQVLASETLARSDQLKRFLKFVCEMGIQGRGGEITEYRIAVEALGRPEAYSPTGGSAVRNRAWALRHKLEECYANEMPGARIRVQLPKGSYVPRFVEYDRQVIPPEETEPRPPEAPARGPARTALLPFLAGMAVAAAAGVLLFLIGRPSRERPEVLEAVLEAWGPLLEPDANVLVCVATPAHLFLRQYGPDALPKYPPSMPEAPAGLLNWYAERHPLAPGARLYMLPTHNSPLWGDAVGAGTVARVLAAAGASFQVLPERVVSLATLRRRNVLLFGSPEYSETARRLLAKAAFTIDYAASDRDWAIMQRGPQETERPAFLPGRDEHQRAIHVYGLVTVLPSEGSTDSQQHTVIFSGLTSAGTQAAAEFFSSSASLLDLRERFRTEGRPSFPPAYQVVVESTADATLALTFRYKTHVALP